MDRNINTRPRYERGEDGKLYREIPGSQRYENDPEMPTGNPHIPYFQVCVSDWEELRPTVPPERPFCENKTCPGRKATEILIWELDGSRQTRLWCETCANAKGRYKGRWMGKLLRWHEGKWPEHRDAGLCRTDIDIADYT
ncbi:MAG TPA: hypothetical protein VIH76_07420 [Candidatus Acidoferrales bacterium]